MPIESLNSGIPSLFSDLSLFMTGDQKGIGEGESLLEKVLSMAPQEILTILSDIVKGTPGSDNGQGVVVEDIDVPNDEGGNTNEKVEKNLEKIIAKLKEMCDEKQIESIKTQLKSVRETVKNKHSAQMEKIKHSIEEAEKAEKNAKIARIFGWIGAAIAVAIAAIASVVSGGIAVGPCVAALLAVTSLVIQEVPGAQEAIAKGLGELCNAVQKLFTGKEMSAEDKKLAGTIAFTAIMLAASIATMCIPGGAVIPLKDAVNNAEKIMKIVSMTQKCIQIGLSGVNMGTGIAGAVLGYAAAFANAEAKDVQRALLTLQDQQEDLEKMLEELMEAMQNNVSDLTQFMDDMKGCLDRIMQEIGNSQSATGA